MSLPQKAEDIEKNPAMRRLFALVCIVLGVAGFMASGYQRHQASSQMGTLVTNSKALVERTSTLVDNMATVVVLVPQVSALNAKVVELGKKIEAAKGNPQLVSILQSQAKDVQKQADVASQQLVLAMVPGVAQVLHNLASDWYAKDDAIVTKYSSISMDALSRYRDDPAQRDAAQRAAQNELVRQKLQLARLQLLQLQTILQAADSLRRQLLNQLHSNQTQGDKDEAALFAEALAGKAADPIYLMKSGPYLQDLAERVKSQTNTNPVAH